MMLMKKIAIIDLGSNSARLAVAEINGNDFNIIMNDSVFVRLAEGLTDESNTLKPEPSLRAVLAIGELVKKCADFGCDSIEVIATEAVRRADNSGWFVSLVKEATGLDVNILSGGEEAYFDCLAIMHRTGYSDFIMIDTGGGSTEIAYVSDGKLKNYISAPWGAVIINKMFSSGDTLTKEEFRNALAHVSDGFAAIDWLFFVKNLPVVMLGGSLRCYYDYSDEYTLSEFAEKMLSMTIEEREKFGIEKRRSDTITAGLVPAIILEAVSAPSELTACDCGVREGYITDMLRKNK